MMMFLTGNKPRFLSLFFGGVIKNKNNNNNNKRSWIEVSTSGALFVFLVVLLVVFLGIQNLTKNEQTKL